MALLTLKDVGKIYATDGNVAVGIRGVNLSFERGEFVAVTGKSGSGKSTLLNVISGMESYEEGEMLIEGEPTSHFAQPDWEAYREEYISFIFQDYNIIESFTVLQNVELALLHVEDPRARRARAMELIRRVGLESHAKHKGSKLSGGQKQRTVIARALAKDSPIILADEPTGNLDSATSKEIIKLLREVSRDKLLIVVTHNFDEVEAYATRHIRIYDGTVEADHTLIAAPVSKEPVARREARTLGRPSVKKTLENGSRLGGVMFRARPRLSVFLCLLMTVGALGVFLVTSMFGNAWQMSKPHYMFEPMEGRVVLAHRNGAVLTDKEVADLAAEYGAEGQLHYDLLLDDTPSVRLPQLQGERGVAYGLAMKATYDEPRGRIIGRAPQAKNEVLLRLPIEYRPYVGAKELLIDRATVGDLDWTVVGVSYYYDNNKLPVLYMTEDGFRALTAVNYLRELHIQVLSESESGEAQVFEVDAWSPSFDAGNTVRLPSAVAEMIPDGKDWSLSVALEASYREYNYDYMEGEKTQQATVVLTGDGVQVGSPKQTDSTEKRVEVGVDVLTALSDQVMEASYRQASLFFDGNGAAHAAAERMQAAGYVAVPADTTYSPDPSETILNTILLGFMAAVWFVTVLFIGFFVNLCASRSLGAFRGDVAIMRSMGIPVKAIRVGLYAQMLLSVIPACLAVAVTAVVIFTTPALSAQFHFLYAGQYALMLLGLLLLVWRVSRKQVRRLFKVSVKRALRGGESV